MLSNTVRFRFAPYFWIPIAWVAFAIGDAAKTVGSMRGEGMHHNWTLLFTIEALSWLPWAIGSLAIIWLADRLRNARPAIEWSAHVAAAIGIGLASTVWFDQIFQRSRAYAPDFPQWAPQWPADFYDNLLTTAVLYGCVLLSYKLIVSRATISAHETEVAQLNEQLASAHLRALRSQIEPHFLFNALNAVAGLIREGRADAAVTMIVQLSDFLRRTLSEANRQEVSLADEIEFARRYLTIQQARFTDRLQIDFEVQDGLQDAAVPNLILQPLVENAIVHGMTGGRSGIGISIAARRDGDDVVIRVTDDGAGLDGARERSGGGRGLANTRMRLAQLYGDGERFRIARRSEGGTEVELRVPYRVA